MNKFLIAEYCRGPFYMGWHLYLRENKAFKRNKDGGWGWIRKVKEEKDVMSFLSSIGITIKGDGTCDYDGIAEIARRFPVNGKKSRGCIAVDVGEYGEIELREK